MKTDFSFFYKRRFFPLFGSQLLSVFNDNLVRVSIFVLITYHGLGVLGIEPALLNNVAAGLFMLPYFLFSATASHVCERFDEAKVAKAVKISEICIVTLSGVGFYLHSAVLLLIALFLMGIHSTFFGIVKYSILPKYLSQQELVGGNGLVEMGTFIAILSGQIVGTQMVKGGAEMMIALTLTTAIVGYAFAYFMPKLEPVNPQQKVSFNIAKDTKSIIVAVWRHKDLRAAILGLSWFWLLGSVYTTQLISFTKLNLGGSEDVFTLLLALFSIGIAIGSVTCAKLSKGNLELGLVLVGAFGMTIAGSALAFPFIKPYEGAEIGIGLFLQTPQYWISMISILCLGFFGGFFTVPLYTWLQYASANSSLSQAVAVNNIVNAIYMVFAAGASTLLLLWLDNVAILFVLIAIGNVFAMAHLVKVAPVIWETKFSWLKRH
ncbi:MFS transporter [Neisseria sp. Ec49-e6-T10]|uniref:MFS transporter n=1 Tax=Neisseria sp. Ec49-e6-T10 TaxID=3140744 RepID=UPI003EB7BFBA